MILEDQETLDYRIGKDDYSFRYSEMYAQLRKYSDISASFRRKVSLEEQDSLLRVKEKNQETKNKLVEANLMLVVKVARDIFPLIQSYRIDILDLISAGNDGLTKAIDRFDSCRGNACFSSCAIGWIKTVMRDSLPGLRSGLRAPIGKHMASKVYVSSFHDYEDENREINLPQEIIQSREGSPLSILSLKEDLSNLFLLLEKLNERTREILKMRFGFYETEECRGVREKGLVSRTSIGRKFGISHSMVENIEKATLPRLRLMMG